MAKRGRGYRLRKHGRPGNDEKGSYENLLPGRGVRKPYILARLQRDRPSGVGLDEARATRPVGPLSKVSNMDQRGHLAQKLRL
jgi:hypothetical protein